ncbi:hypothetical protein F9L33_12465 [Amylibacter sp. SFDW26]|uniref:hypothetical protein n=1 Tax=Amylibacter sp. SFDW26 TaxID=2652722 RepID=UPI0012620BF8|nr:hypothetical protein [Amylibacter sp. SFDW26]KAB7613405.1 hypothetical protein F9L33_12465 [Amylibacter sp. SFDW26]
MKPFKLEAKHMVPVKDTAFAKDRSTKLLRSLVQRPEAVMEALENTDLRFSLVPQKRRVVRLG